MLELMSKLVILSVVGIWQIVQSDEQLINGTLNDGTLTYNVVEGDDLNITCTVYNRINESIWWQVKHGNAAQYNPAIPDVSNNITFGFAENFEYHSSETNENEFILRIINISQTASRPTIICGYVPDLPLPLSQNFSTLFSAKIYIWVEPKCLYEVTDDDDTQIKLTCSTAGHSNPSPGLQWYQNGITPIGNHTDNIVETFIDTDTVDYGNPYVCQIDSEGEVGRNLTCEIIIPSPTIFPPTESIEDPTIEHTTIETINTNNPTTKPVDGFWTDMIIFVIAAPGGTLALILLILIVACVCLCVKKNKTDKHIDDAETASDTKTKSDVKINDTATSNSGVNETNGGMKMNDTIEMKNYKTEIRKDDAIPVYDDVANEDNAEKTIKSNGELNNGQDKETENIDENGESIPLYDNMRDDKAGAQDMSKANVEGLEYADIEIGSKTAGEPTSVDVIRTDSATIYADVRV